MTISKLLWYLHQSDCYSVGRVEGDFSEVLWDLCKISVRVLWDFCEISISQIVILLGGWKEISQILAHSASEERYRGSFIARASFFIFILVMSSLPSLLQPSQSSRFPYCVLLLLSWNTITNENPTTDVEQGNQQSPSTSEEWLRAAGASLPHFSSCLSLSSPLPRFLKQTMWRFQISSGRSVLGGGRECKSSCWIKTQ